MTFTYVMKVSYLVKQNPCLIFVTHTALHGHLQHVGGQWLSGRVLDSRPRGRGFEPHWRHCVVSLSKNINSSLGKTRPFITERLLMERKESN